MIGRLTELLAAEGRRIGRSLRRNAMLCGAAALSGLTAFLAAVAAAGLALAAAIGPVTAALLIAAGFACLAALLIYLAVRCNRRDRERMRRARATAVLALSGGELAAAAVRRKPLLLVLGAGVAAFVLALMRDRAPTN